eukprot:5752229-Amphidinium_carterae.1
MTSNARIVSFHLVGLVVDGRSPRSLKKIRWLFSVPTAVASHRKKRLDSMLGSSHRSGNLPGDQSEQKGNCMQS